MKIRLATIADYDDVWSMFQLVIKSGDTFVNSPDTEKSGLKSPGLQKTQLNLSQKLMEESVG